jgi:hypothetical protein
MKNLLLLLTLFVFTTPAVAQKIKVDYNKTTDFSKFKTFSWTRGAPPTNPLINQIIIDTVEQSLAAKGLTKVNDGGDLLISVAVAIQYDIQVAQQSRGNTGSDIQTGIPTGAGLPFDVRKGSLVVDMESPAAKSIVWHGIASDTLRYEPSGDMQKDAKKVEGRLRKAVNKLMEKYPSAK